MTHPATSEHNKSHFILMESAILIIGLLGVKFSLQMSHLNLNVYI